MAASLQRVVKPRTRKGKAVLLKREPQLVEETKNAIFIRGSTANNAVTQLMKDLAALKKPHAVFFNKKNDWRPFEDSTHLEFMVQKNESPLFMFASHSKKRPNNMIIGRTYDNHVLDMVEVGVENLKLMSDFKTAKISLGSKPLLLFSGEPFETEFEYQRLKSILIDFFVGPKPENIRLQGLENVYQFVAHEGKVYFRNFRIVLKKSGTRLPRVELDEMGPSFTMAVRRHHLASDDLLKRAMRQPSQLKPKKVKNVSKSRLGTTFAKIHMERQNYGRLQTRKMKGLRKESSKRTLKPEPEEGTQSSENPPKKVRFDV
jgi:ribosome production factor 2